MPWTKEMHEKAQSQLNGFAQEFQGAIASWQNGVQSGQPAQYETQVQNILRQWRQFTTHLRESSEAATANQGVMDLLGQLVAEVGEQQQVLARLRSEAGTRVDQADSLNPKVRPSPYTNILGLQRTFKESTRTAIFWIAIVFGALTLGAIGFMAAPLIIAMLPKNDKEGGSGGSFSAEKVPGSS